MGGWGGKNYPPLGHPGHLFRILPHLHAQSDCVLSKSSCCWRERVRNTQRWLQPQSSHGNLHSALGIAPGTTAATRNTTRALFHVRIMGKPRETVVSNAQCTDKTDF